MSNDFAEFVLIALLGLATYGLRAGGYLLLARFEPLDRRIEAALDAVPIAVITAIVAPVVLTTGLAETIAAGLTVVAAMRLPVIPTLVIAAVAVSLLRAVGL